MGLLDGKVAIITGAGGGIGRSYALKFAQAGAKAHGFEVALFPYVLAKIKKLGTAGKKNIRFSYKDFWHADLSDANIVYFFLMPGIYPKLKAKLEKECAKGTRIIAYVWPMPGWSAEKVDAKEGFAKLYLYRL